ncbi:Uncharacterized protein APZ42_004707, partial [Daphnia magna]
LFLEAWHQQLHHLSGSSRISVLGVRIFLNTQPTYFHMDYQRHACLAFSVPPSQYCRYGNINP